MAEWDTEYVNSLPDSAFACIDAGGDKDEDGKTVPRSKRHYPHHSSSGAVDLPHLRNALSRVAQEDTTSCGVSHLRAHASAEDIGKMSDGVQRKTLKDIEWKADKPGTFRAVVATYNTIDHDGDVTEPGALDTERRILVSPWNHSSIDEAAAEMPVGSAKITTVGDRAVAEGRFYIDDPMGERAYKITKALAEDGLGEWSYGFRIPAGGSTSDPKALEGWPGAVRLLKRVQPFEVSLVFAGAGIGTHTLSVKSLSELKRGARLSKESRLRLRSLAEDLLAFIGEAEEEPEADAPKVDANVQSQLRATREYLERLRARDRFIDLRLI